MGTTTSAKKKKIICTLGKVKQYFCSCLKKTLIMLSAVFEIIKIFLSVKS